MVESLIKGKTALITGASSGIGAACAQALAALGVNLVITARRLERLQELSERLASECHVVVKPYQVDVRSSSEIEALQQALEKEGIFIDILINNAGLALSLNKLQEGKLSDFDQMIDTNIKGLLYMTKAVLPSMLTRNSGHIINIGSIAGQGTYVAGNVYCATKHAVRALTESLRLDLNGTAIKVSEIAPGAVETEFSEVRFDDKERAKKVYEGFCPLRAEDIADAVIYTLTRPLPVTIAEMVILPQAQASLTMIHRKEI
jgi:NADP-dependent 3-hydroxy acid dehydrogenase YdfG